MTVAKVERELRLREVKLKIWKADFNLLAWKVDLLGDKRLEIAQEVRDLDDPEVSRQWEELRSKSDLMLAEEVLVE